MAGTHQRGILIVGLILMGLGALFLMENWYWHGFTSFWRLLARYWPLILISVGLRKIYLFIVWQKARTVTEGTIKE